MKRPPNKLVLTFAVPLLWAAPFQTAHAALTPEKQVARIARKLKPIQDDEWKNIAGARLSESYEVAKGDSLSEISKRLFGDMKYWPKIWALNNGAILNPHQIFPGSKIAFLPGSGTALPGVSVGGTATDAPSPVTVAPSAPETVAAEIPTNGRSQEWRKLPPQGWEEVKVQLPAEVDKDGFGKQSRVHFGKPKGYELEALAASERVTTLGSIIGSRTAANYPGLGEIVYIRPDGELQVGMAYALTQEPTILKARKSNRRGYSYPILGYVKLLGVKDGLFIGQITGAKGIIFRGASLIPLPPRVALVTPIPGPSQIAGTLMIDASFSTASTAQFKQAFVDRGSDDGVKPGMIFRAYQYYDPSNEKKITDADLIIDADFMVLQTSPSISAVTILSGRSTVTENSTVVLLTDVSDLIKNKKSREILFDTSGKKRVSDPLDQLEQLDTGGGLGVEEERELKQLEKWEQNPNEKKEGAPEQAQPNDTAPVPQGENQNLPAPPSDLAPPPSGDLPAPPAGEVPPPTSGVPEAVEKGRSGEVLPPVPAPEEQ